jgi:hypothetical protein
VRYTRVQRRRVGDVDLEVPSELTIEDPRRGLRVVVDVSDAHVTELERERFRYFVQMRGIAEITLDGQPVGRLPGFFETYLD